ncbi:MAG TPA: hypothetical protein VF860_07795 [Candidatus Acidoferrales bacterium]
MLFLRFLLIAIGVGLFGSASGVIAYDIYLAAQLRRLLGRKAQEGGSEAGEKAPRPLALVRWKLAQRLAVLAVAPFPLRLSNVRIPWAAARARARAN